jgi:hypothetical protein
MPVFPRLARRLLVVAVVIVLLLVGLDIGARVLAQDQIASRARTATGAATSSASIGGFPFLGHLLLQGTVPHLDVHLTGVPVGTLQLHDVDVVLTGTVVDRGALFGSRTVHLVRIAAGDATVTVTAAELSNAAGQQVVLPGNGQATVEVAGRQVPATVVVVDGHLLEVRAAGVTLLSTDLRASPLVPDCGLVLTLGRGEATVTCHVAPVPARLVQTLAGS